MSFVDLKTLATKLKVGTGENPDAFFTSLGLTEVYAFNGEDSLPPLLTRRAEGGRDDSPRWQT